MERKEKSKVKKNTDFGLILLCHDLFYNFQSGSFLHEMNFYFQRKTCNHHQKRKAGVTSHEVSEVVRMDTMEVRCPHTSGPKLEPLPFMSTREVTTGGRVSASNRDCPRDVTRRAKEV